MVSTTLPSLSSSSVRTIKRKLVEMDAAAGNGEGREKTLEAQDAT